MKIAILIQCHQLPEQINLFLSVMKHPSIRFFLHIDKKSSMESKIEKRSDVYILPEHLRIDVRWATISQIDATLNLLEYAENQKEEFDFYWLCSGQDFPIKPVDEIVNWFENNPHADFINLYASKNNGLGHGCKYDKRNEILFTSWLVEKKVMQRIIKRLYIEITGGYKKTFKIFKRNPVLGMKFYFGSQWICLSKRTLKWINGFLALNSEYYQYFKRCNCPDESFFQTLVMNSPYAKYRKDYLHYVDWSEGGNNPKTLKCNDFAMLKNSAYFIARKFDIREDSNILNMLVDNVLSEDKNESISHKSYGVQ